MKHYKILIFLNLFLSFFAHATRVRVLLKEEDLSKSFSWEFDSDSGFILAHPNYKRRGSADGEKLVVSIKNGNLYFDKKKLIENQVLIGPVGDYIGFEDKTYQGYIQIKLSDKKIYMINVLELEDYVFSVLRTEGWPGWPGEVNKVFAITCRTYVISQLIDARKYGLLYDVKNTNVHQTYKGIHPVKNLRKAVEETDSLFLGYENKPILAMFDSCCGGVVPCDVSGIDFKKAPYLARDYACKYCKSCKIYRYNIDYSISHLKKVFGDICKDLKIFKEIKVSKKDKAGLVDEVLISDGKNSVRVSGKKIYSLLREIKSFCFSIERKNKNTFVFKGRGFGHHIGLCQWGAREMVRQGWGYKGILEYYYPKTKLMVLKNKEES